MLILRADPFFNSKMFVCSDNHLLTLGNDFLLLLS
jgi:hypothetical protein